MGPDIGRLNELKEERLKLASIEEGATQDQTGSEIKILYESENDTNAFTDIEKDKLADSDKLAIAFAVAL